MFFTETEVKTLTAGAKRKDIREVAGLCKVDLNKIGHLIEVKVES